METLLLPPYADIFWLIQSNLKVVTVLWACEVLANVTEASHIKEILDHWKSILKKAEYLLNAAPNMNLLAAMGQGDSKQG